MGCDIHMVVEVRDGEGQPWREASDSLCWDDRNYTLFSVLAGVRNGTWNEPIAPISEPRGYPKGHSKDDGDYDRHSASWLTARDLVNYDWDAEMTMRAVVSWEQWKDMERVRRMGIRPNSPDGYAASSSCMITEEMARLIYDKKEPLPSPPPFVRTTWKSDVAAQVGGHALAWVLRLARQPQGLDNVRIVFDFDN